jgi:DNA-binding NarL/FixJ family response regulator
LVIDDHTVIREGLCQLLSREPDLAVVGDAKDVSTAAQMCKKLNPDAAIIDLSLGHESGLQLITQLRADHPAMAMLVLSMHDETVFAERALQSGANGYVMKHESTSVLLQALRRVLDGKTYVSETVAQMLLDSLAGRAPSAQERSGLSRLSNREVEILRLIGQGLKTSKIAELLQLSPKTVETHRERIKEKLNLATASELVVLAVNWLRDGFLNGPHK